MATTQPKPTQPYKMGTPMSNQQFSPINRLYYGSNNTKGLSEDTYSTKAESKAVWKHRKTINSCSRVRLPPYANLAWTALLNSDFHLCMSLKGGEEFTDNTCLCTKQATLPSVHY